MSYNLLVEHFDLILYLVQVMISVVHSGLQKTQDSISQNNQNGFELFTYTVLQFMVISIMLFKILKVWFLRQKKNLRFVGFFYL